MRSCRISPASPQSRGVRKEGGGLCAASFRVFGFWGAVLALFVVLYPFLDIGRLKTYLPPKDDGGWQVAGSSPVVDGLLS